MFNLLDVGQGGYETLQVDRGTPMPIDDAPDGAPRMSHEAYRPGPRTDGSLCVDPEIHLPSPGMNVDISYFYYSDSKRYRPYGFGRTINLDLSAQTSDANIVTLTRGDGSEDGYQLQGSTYVPLRPGLLNELREEDGLWKEETPDGLVAAYPVVQPEQTSRVSYIQDAVGNRHTFTYQNAAVQPGLQLLRTLEDAVGRLVTFQYTNDDYLESILDWAGRRTTFTYNTITREFFLPKRVLQRVQAPTGAVTTFVHGQFPRLTRIIDPNGHQTTYAYNGQGKIAGRTIVGESTTRYNYGNDYMEVEQPDGGLFTYMFADEKRVTTVINPAGLRVTMSYNSRGQQFQMERMDSVVTTLYDAHGFPSGSIDPLGQTTAIARDGWHNPTSITNPDGAVTELVWGYQGSPFDEDGRKRRLQVYVDPMGGRTSYTYNERGQVTSVEDPTGALTTFAYDALGNMVSVSGLPIINGMRSVTTVEYDGAGNVTKVIDPLNHQWKTWYDALNRPYQMEDPLGRVSTLVYDGVGNITRYIDALDHTTELTYNAYDLVTSVKDPLNNTTRMYYDLLGRPQMAKDALGRITTAVYDTSGRLQTMIDPLEHRVTIGYDTSGRPVSTEEPGGYITTTAYDRADRVIAVEDARGYRTTINYDVANRRYGIVDALEHVTTVSYDLTARTVETMDALGRVQRVLYDTAGRLLAGVDALGYRTTFNYDPNGTHMSVQDARGNITTAIYETRGQLQAIITPLNYRTTFNYDQAGQQISVQDPLRYLHTAVYDALGRVYASVDPLGYRTTLAFDAAGRLESVTDALDQRTTLGYDAMGQLRWEENALGYRTTVSYDVRGLPVSLQNANGGISTQLYDARGLLIGEQDALEQWITYSYDAAGNLTQRQDARGITTNYNVDRVGRTDRVEYSTGIRITLSYDPLDQVEWMADRWGRTTFTYDGIGQLKTVAYPLNENLSYDYDQVGNRTLMIDPDNGRTTYTWDAQNRLSGIRNPQNEWTRFGYNALDQETSRIYPNNMSLTRIFNANGQVRQHSYAMPGLLRGFISTYDRAGRRTLLTETDTNVVTALTTFTYDAAHQLLTERRNNPAFVVTHTYDPAGNRLSKQDTGSLFQYTYDLANQLVTQLAGGATTIFTYDGNGNNTGQQLNTSLVTHTYDEENRLLTTLATGVDNLHEYSGDGRRIRYQPSLASAAWVRFVWDGANVLQETNQAGATIAQYTDYPGLPGELISMRRAGVTTYYGFDHMANTRLLLDTSGTVLSTYAYKSFGDEVGHTGTTPNPYRYGGEVGYYRDRNVQQYARNRHYSVPVARWMQRDPIGFESGDANLYRYVRNCPTCFIDPDGLDLLDTTTNFTAGIGNTLTLGITDRISNWISERAGFGSIDPVIDRTSGAYRVGQATGVGIGAGLGAGYAGTRISALGARAFARGLVPHLTGAATDVAINAGLTWFSGDCYSWRDAAKDVVIGAVGGAVISRVYRGIRNYVNFGRVPWRTRIVRTFLEDRTSWNQTTNFLERMRRTFPGAMNALDARFGQGWLSLEHMWIKQRFYRSSSARGPRIPRGTRLNRIVQRMGDAGLNLFPVPTIWNSTWLQPWPASIAFNMGVYTLGAAMVGVPWWAGSHIGNAIANWRYDPSEDDDSPYLICR